MLLIETNIGNFGDVRSLYYEMLNLNIDSVEVVGKYFDSRLPKMELTLSEVKKLMEEC